MAVQNTSGEGDVNVVQFRIERGAEALATDGRIGIVEQLVVDRTSGQLLSLVIRGEETNTEFEMPAAHVLRSTGDHVYLDISRADLTNNPEITTPYDPALYVPVYQGDAMPPGVASRVAAEREKPVVTDVEQDAAQLIAPEATATPRDDDLASADSTPTLKLGRVEGANRPPTDWNEAVGTQDRPVPVPETSPTPETTGPLMGGKPSTGGMGTASTVPSSTDPALDTVATSPDLPPYTTEHPAETQPPTPNLVTANEAAVMPEAMTPEATTGIPMQRTESQAPVPTSPEQTTVPARQLADLRDHLPDLLVNMAKSPEIWILAGSLGAGIAGGIVARRRTVTRKAAAPLHQASGALELAQNRLAETVGETLEGAKRTSARTRQQVRKSARRAARRGRWFRRGLLLGSAGAMLFAPQRGEETRMQLKARLERLRSRIA